MTFKTDDTPKTADAVVIGGGVMGCSILYNLAARGMSNTVLLEKDALASGSTGRSQAILRMHYSNEVTTRMAWDSLKILRDFEDVTGSPSGYVRTGYLLIVGPEDRGALEDNVAMQRGVGVGTSVRSVGDAKDAAPMLAFQGDEAVAYEPDSGYADPYSVTSGYARRAGEMGAQVRLGTSAGDIVVKGGKVTAAVTSNGRIETPVAVVVAGPWSKPLLDKIGVEVPLRTVRHQIITLRRPEDQVPHHPTISDVVNSLSARPDAGNLTLIGVGEDEFVGPQDYHQGVDMPVVEEAMKSLVRQVPKMSEALFRGGWSGLFTTTPDWHPVLDKIEGIDGLYCAVGFSGHGFKLSPMVGVAMAELITRGRSESVDISKLRLGRFADGELLGSRYRMSVLA